jgi:hypothetical protein
LQVLEGSFLRKGAKGPEALLNMVGRGIHRDQCFFGIGVRGISITFAHKWLKSSVERLSEKGYEQHS